MQAETLESKTATIYRVRIAHVHTLKDGWRVSETTVEATGTEIDYDQIHAEMKEAYERGMDEAHRRNRLEKDYNRGVMSPTPKPTIIGTPEMGS